MWNVAWVSRRWRAIALGTPTLWSNIHISYEAWRERLITTQLERSRDALLSITIDLDFELPKWTQEDHFRDFSQYLERVMALLRGQLYRWRSLDVAINCYTENGQPSSYDKKYYHIVLRPLRKATAPALQSLRIIRAGRRGDESIFRGGTPSLSTVALFGTVDIGLPNFLSVTFLVLHETGTMLLETDFHRILASCPCLTHLSLIGVPVHAPSTAHVLPVLELPAVVSLSLSALVSDDATYPWTYIMRRRYEFDYLSMPNLHTLYLTVSPIETFPEPCFSPARPIDPAQLHDPNYFGNPIDYGVHGILSFFPSIKRLSVDSYSLFHVLIRNVNASHVLCPQLRTLIWTSGDGYWPESCDFPLHVARRRKADGHPLAEISIPHEFYERMDADVLEQLGDIVKLGISD
ncbi:hypothetical protein OE88DRAFT_907885 [Heliocybe sulcata]|uniref:F-box domain-containing protein n=1 Tax=Heliocybe sulcata TaxID=5364 RepID=A0A5C3MQE1_9AGAM|nr:hypothetical protein OE88DRAFT_907885 [Heliocybe sulcata]